MKILIICWWDEKISVIKIACDEFQSRGHDVDVIGNLSHKDDFDKMFNPYSACIAPVGGGSF